MKCKYCGEEINQSKRGRKKEYCNKEDCLRQARNEANRKWYANKMNKEQEEAIKYFNECIEKDTIYEEDLTLNFMKIAKEYIEQLEIKEQKLINYLESKNINTIEKEGQEPCKIYKSKKATIEIEEDIKIVEEFIEDYKIAEEVVDGNLIDSLETILSMLKEKDKKLEKKDKIIDEIAHYIWKYDCCEYEICKIEKCKGYYLDKDCGNKCIKQYFEKRVEEV